MTNTAFQSICEVLRSDKSDTVRLTALALLWNVHEEFPEVAALVENIAANDLAKEVRQAANELLEEQPKP
jgi:hypothetical protein